MGALSPEELDVALRRGADVVAWREGFVRRLAAQPDGRGARVHVKLDTGMGRLGTRDPEEATRVAEAVAAARRLRLAGAMTHFATADDDPAFLAEQLARFPPWARRSRPPPAPPARRQLGRHAARARRARFDMVRCGIAIYGMDPFHQRPGRPRARAGAGARLLRRRGQARRAGRERGLRAPLRRRARRPGSARSRSATATASGAALTNDADALIGGRRVPLVGTVSMDNVTVDLGARPRRGAATEAVLIGAQGGERILAEDWARGSARSTTRSPAASAHACRGCYRAR